MGFASSLDELPPQTRRLLDYIRQLVKEKKKQESEKAALIFSRKEVRNLSGWSLTQLAALNYPTRRAMPP